MKLKIYERTKIKEEKALKESQSKIIEKWNSEQKIKCSIKRGIYKENCKNSYNLELMDYKKEYKKIKDMLKLYKEKSITYEENIRTLIEGYVE